MTSPAQLTRQMRITINYGYGLFILTLAALAVSVFPWFCLYPNDVPQDFSGTLFILTTVFTAVVPSLIGFLSGRAATRDGSTFIQHYNGVLFGVLGVWLWLAFGMVATIMEWTVVVENNFQHTLITIAPALLAGVATIILGVIYARSKQTKKMVIDYLPYRWVLFLSVASLILSFGVTALFGLHYGSNILMTLLINLIVPLLCILVVTLLGYWALGEKSGTVGERVVYSLVAIAYGIAAIMVAGQLSSKYSDWQQFLLSFGVAALAIAWATYLYFLRRAAH